MKFNRLYSIVLLFAISVVANAQSWTDVTNLFVKNADFMQGNAYWQGTNFWNVNIGEVTAILEGIATNYCDRVRNNNRC